MRYCKRNQVIDYDPERILEKFYSAHDLILIFGGFISSGAHDPVIKAFFGDNFMSSAPRKKMLKQDRIKSLIEVFKDHKLFMSFYGCQTRECKIILEALVWYGPQDLAALEKRTGKRIAVKEKGERSSWEPFQLVSGLELLLLEYFYSYRYHRREVQKSEVVAFLPNALQDLFQKNMPKPAAYTITALKRRGKTEFTHSSESTALGELVLIADFIRQGHLPLKKNGIPMVKGLRTLVQLSSLQEFYPPEAGKEFEHVKIELLTSFLLGNTAGNAASDLPPHKLLHTLFAHFTKDDTFLLSRKLLKHLRIQTRGGYYNFQEYNIKKDLKFILQHLPLEKWVSLDSLLDFCLVRKLTLHEREISAFECYKEVDHGYGRYNAWETINRTTVVPLIHLPVLQAFFFLSAALGMVEIAYNLPENLHFQRPKQKYLSSYDGLRYVRLTPLGAYAAGKKKSYTPVEQEHQQETVFTLDKKRLLLTMEGKDPIAALTLKKILKPLGSGRFIMSYESLFSNCYTRKDVQNKIRMFKETVSSSPPQNWKKFFGRALKRINPLTPEPDFKIMKVRDNEELLNLLASDPEITPLIRKVEGLRIAVNKKNLSKLNRLLRKHGFLIAGSTLAP